MDEADRHRSFANGRGDALDRPGVDVADREHPRLARLQKQRAVAGVSGQLLVAEIAPGEQKAVLVQRDVAVKPRRCAARRR